MTPNIPAIDYEHEPRAIAVATAAKQLDDLRSKWLNPPDVVRIEPEIVPGYPPIARRRMVEGKRRKPLASDRDLLVATLWRTAERTARDLGERLARPGASTPERERDVRMFGMTVRALRELSLFDAGGPAAPADDEPPADIDEFRRELARRIHALIDAEQAGQGQAADQRASIAKS